MYIEDFVRRVAMGWRALLASIVVCVVIMGAFLAVYPPQYEGSIAIKIGTVPPGNPIESVPSVAARLRNAYVLRATLKELNLPATDRQVDRLRSAIRVSPVDDSTFQMTLRWPDRAQALLIIGRLTDDMIAAHAAMEASIGRGITDRIRQNAADISRATTPPAANRTDPNGEDTGAARVLHALQSQNDQAIAAFAVTSPTVVTFPADVTDEPVFPKRAQMLVLAALVGFAFGVAWTFGSRPREAR